MAAGLCQTRDFITRPKRGILAELTSEGMHLERLMRHCEGSLVTREAGDKCIRVEGRQASYLA